MNYYVAIPFVAVIFNLVFATYIFAQNRKDPVNEAYILLSVFFIGWMFFDIIHWSPVNPEWIMPLLRAQSFFWLLSGFMFTHFAYTFLKRPRDVGYYFFLSLSMATVPLGLTSDLVIAGYKPEVWGTAIRPGPLYVPAVVAVVLSPFVYSLGLFARRMLITGNVVERNQCRLILYGTAVAVFITFITIIVMPHFLDFPALPQTHFAIMIHLLFVFMAVIKYQFLSIGIQDAAQDIFSSVNDGVVLLDNTNKVAQINSSASEIFSLGQDDDAKEVMDQLLGGEIDQKSVPEFETEYVVDGALRVLRVSRSPLQQSGKLVGSILFVSDITERKQAEYEVSRINTDLAKARDEALAASKAKSQFLANMSHELRTPLNAIIGYSEMLKEEAAETGNQVLISDLGRINSAGHHLLLLINDILDLSKIEAGRMELFVEQVDVSTLVGEIVEVVQPLLRKNDNNFVLDGHESAGIISTDLTKLRQILYNLVSNAAKFTSAGEVRFEITRYTESRDDRVSFKISDTGIGMSDHHVARLFENFSQADASTTRKYGGTGLGLAISRKFCELLGGEIRVSSVEGQGSIFDLHIPADLSR